MALLLNAYDFYPLYSYRPIHKYYRYPSASWFYSLLNEIDYELDHHEPLYTNYYVATCPRNVSDSIKKDAVKDKNIETKESPVASLGENKKSCCDNICEAKKTEAQSKSDKSLKAWSIKTKEETDKFTISAYLPGVSKDSISLEVHGDKLYLSAIRKVEEKSEHFNRSYSESVSRVFVLPKGTDPAAINAKFDNDTLSLEVPLPKEIKNSQSKKIEIKSALNTVSSISPTIPEEKKEIESKTEEESDVSKVLEETKLPEPIEALDSITKAEELPKF